MGSWSRQLAGPPQAFLTSRSKKLLPALHGDQRLLATKVLFPYRANPLPSCLLSLLKASLITWLCLKSFLTAPQYRH